MEPNSSLYHTWLGHTYGNRINNVIFLKKMGTAQNIKKQYEKALELDPNKTDAIAGIITFHTEAPGIVGGSKDKAKEFAERLKVLDKYYGYRALGRIYEKQKNMTSPKKNINQLLLNFPIK